MNIKLADWLKLDELKKKAKESCNELASAIFEITSRFSFRPNSDEGELLNKVLLHVAVAEEELGFIDVHPQSEWTGGNSDDPKNHVLREPHCVGLSPRRFTREEMAEAGVVFHGPCQYEVKK